MRFDINAIFRCEVLYSTLLYVVLTTCAPCICTLPEETTDFNTNHMAAIMTLVFVLFRVLLLFRHLLPQRTDLSIYGRFYAALGTTRVEEMYSMTGSQWIRLCKDILIISEQMPSSVLSAMHSEVCANAHTHALMLKDFYILAVQVAVKLYPMAAGEYECVDKLLTEAMLPNAQTDPDATNQAFRELLYKPSVQAVWHEACTIILGVHLPHKPTIIYIISACGGNVLSFTARAFTACQAGYAV